MPRTMTTEKTIFTFDELSDSAKERARDWFRESIETFDYDAVIEDFQRIAEIIGISFDTIEAHLYGGSKIEKPIIYWSGFCSQGDGACFEGEYRHNADSCARIREYCSDEDLHRIADELNALQAGQVLLGFAPLAATIRKTSHHYCHEHTVEIDVEDNAEDDLGDIPAEALNVRMQITELMRDLMRWLYCSLERESDWLYSAECVDENIRCNDYEFDEDGRIA